MNQFVADTNFNLILRQFQMQLLLINTFDYEDTDLGLLVLFC